MLPKKGSVKKAMRIQPEAQTSDSLLHVRLAEPTAVRKLTLNLALDMIQLLKRYDRLAEIRAKKDTAKRKLTRLYNEMRKYSNTLKLKELPSTGQVKKQTLEIKKELPKAPTVIKTKPELKIKKPAVSLLEQEMELIRNKLSNL